MKRLLMILVVCILFSSTGCAILKPFVKDLGGWDLSACADRKGFEVCKELFLDNEEKIFGGKKIIDVILDNMNNRTEVMTITEEEENGTTRSEND